MSAVFEFDDLPTHDEPLVDEAFVDDAAKARDPAPLDENLYEVPLGENFISSSLTEISALSTTIGLKKVTIDDFEILKLLGRGA